MTMGAKIPGWLDKIQFIKFWVMNPCDVPFIAYIESAQPITNEIALVFLQLDFRQFLRAVFRPKWMRSRRHTRRGPRRGRRLPGVPEPAELIADILDPDHHLRPQRWFLGFRMVLEWFDITDRIFWTIFLVEMADTLIINTLIGVLEADRDVCPNIARALRSKDHITLGGASGTNGTVNVADIEYNVNIYSPNGEIFGVGEGDFVIVHTGAVTRNSPEGTYAARLRITDADGERVVLGPEVRTNETDWRQVMVSERVRGPAYAYIEGVWGVGFSYMAHARAFVIQVGN